ncbi:MAG TPA: tyrosine-type recombinase/integrase [Methylotenera sp.]|nr:tyrosine-type recombinase/integrase [Methylotenera sp.]
MIVKLTESFISTGLQCSGGKRREEMVDSVVPGLFIEVRAVSPGQGTYYYRYKDVNAHTQTKKLGRSNDVTLAEARNQAKALRAEVALGANPRAEEKARKLVITFDTLFTEHYLPYVKPRKRSWDRDEELYRLRIKDVFGSKRLNQITRLQIQTFHSGLIAEGLAAATANHHAKLIRHMLNLACEWQMLDINPASRIHMFEEDNKQERYMNDTQLSNLLEVLRTDSCRSVCLITMFLLATGCRLGEVLSATWSQVDKDKRVFRVLASNSKSKRMRPVPLNDTALEVLNQLDTEGTYEHLFINKKTEKPYVNIAKVWEKLRAKAGLPHLRLHDLRHQAASNLINSGSSLYIVQQILGHSDPSVTQRYAHLSMKTLNDASDNASVITQRAMKVLPSEKVAA